MPTDETTNADDSWSTDTPVFDATLHALTTTQSPADRDIADTDTDSVDTDTAAQRAGAPDADHDSDDLWYDDPPRPPLLNPDTPEGVAILQLFQRLHHRAQTDHGRADSEVLNDLIHELDVFFADLGISSEEAPARAAHQLQQALHDHRGGERASSRYEVRLSTDHADPEPIIRLALRVLARHLGPGTGIDLIAHDRDGLTRFEQHPFPTTDS